MLKFCFLCFLFFTWYEKIFHLYDMMGYTKPCISSTGFLSWLDRWIRTISSVFCTLFVSFHLVIQQLTDNEYMKKYIIFLGQIGTHFHLEVDSGFINRNRAIIGTSFFTGIFFARYLLYQFCTSPVRKLSRASLLEI